MTTLQILVQTMPSRARFLEQFRAVLVPQLKRHKNCSLLTAIDDGVTPVGEQRQKLKERSTGDYICLLDDDDFVAHDFLERISPLLDTADYIGFLAACYRDCVFHKNAVCSALRCKGWHSDAEFHYRELSQLCPMRRELSLAVPMDSAGDERGRQTGDAYRWASQLAVLGIVKTEHFIDEPMVHYMERTKRNDAEDWREPRRMEFFHRLTQKP
jgi:hypothetical protein